MLHKNEINRKEIYRYLGYRGTNPDQEVQNVVEDVLDDLLQAITPKYCYQEFACEVTENTVKIIDQNTKSELLLNSKNLAYTLRSCKKVYLMAATLGIGADQLLQRYEITSMTKASVSQACGAACIERLCDQVQNEIVGLLQKSQEQVRPRFSPGYGDLSLETQRDMFQWLGCAKRLGLTLTESLLMYPTKSVTAILGVTSEQEDCHVGKCNQCLNVECEFRNEI